LIKFEEEVLLKSIGLSKDSSKMAKEGEKQLKQTGRKLIL